MARWVEATTNAIRRHVADTGSRVFTRQAFFTAELEKIVEEAGAGGLTPGQTLGRELQQLRDAGLVAFLQRGTYRWLADSPSPQPDVPSRGVFLLNPRVIADLLPERAYLFEAHWLEVAQRTVDQWIVYQDDDRYAAAARVLRVDPDNDHRDRCRAKIKPMSFLGFGRSVPLQSDGIIIEQGLRDPSGGLDRRRAGQSVRAISREEFDRIIDLGLITGDDLLPRVDGAPEQVSTFNFADERSGFDGPIDRATMLVERKVRSQQFRKRVLDAYQSTCALTGMKLINGGGRVETEAAHIMSVEAGGPDKVANGIALSGTIHWMFDRGLISLSDTGDILLSRKINDREGVERLINADHKARLPINPAERPHPDYLQWHRSFHRFE